MRLFVFVVLLASTSTKGWAQATYNYVPNPSFELMDSCPTELAQFIRLKQWYNPTYGTPDFFHTCSNAFVSVYSSGVPSNFCGYQFPRSGSGYAGFGSVVGMSYAKREYIGVKLKADLIADSTYCVRAWLSRAENLKYAFGCIGFYFSETKLHTYADGGYDGQLFVEPYFFNPVHNYITDTAGWTLIEGSFVAQGGERFLTIGNFFNDSVSEFVLVNPDAPPGITPMAYVYIDDVSVTACNVTAVNTLPHQAALKLYPNPASDQVQLEFSGKGLANALMEVHCVLGRVLLGENIERNSAQLDVSSIHPGAYILVVKDISGNILHRERLVISR